ncbi:tyrosine-type recombinase/integrase [Paenibacillus kribbensis]|uniref:tyrosine-type recombinase/integrase n=1 Tax=Paenibacillus kribbensis TaxID=172713 RepID=UPI002DB5CB71|nr:tyrosine-type recombinase/integrase [Paenibacillus kribbensis]MEC0236759.1 tyrosine-type recombinase/integrase [Paenibacillus kribbensis]
MYMSKMISSQLHAHSIHNPETYTDDQIIGLFLSTCGSSPYTLRNYKRAIQQFRNFTSGKPLRTVTWQDIEVYKIGLLEGFCSSTKQTPAPATIASLLAPLRSLYKWGSDPSIHIFQHNPTTSVRTPKIPVNSKNHFLTKNELRQLLTYLKTQGERNYLIALTLVLLGLRVSEMVAIQWDHFHYDPTETFIWLTVFNGKGGKQREVKVPPRLWNMYKQFKGILPLDEPLDMPERLFPLSVRQVETIIKRAREEVGITKKITPHWFRHTNATLALIQGASLQQVQENLGHSHINTTQRYLHTVSQMQKAAPDYVEDCLKDIL